MIYIGAAIAFLVACAAAFRAFNAPKVEAEKTAQEAEQTKQQLQKQQAADERRNDIEMKKKARRDEAAKRHNDRMNAGKK